MRRRGDDRLQSHARPVRRAQVWQAPAGSSRRGGSGQLLLEEGDRPAPGQIGGLLVVARFRRIVVEGVIHALIDEEFEVRPAVLQRLPVGRNAGIDALVEARIVQHHRRLDLGDGLGRRLGAVIGNRGLEVRVGDRKLVDKATAPAEADRTHLAVEPRLNT